MQAQRTKFSGSNIIEVLDLSKSYSYLGKQVSALNQVSITIEKGDIYGIIGQSGAGKSTLIRCLARLIQPSAGKISFYGNDVTNISGQPLREFYKNIGMVFQSFNLLGSRTVAENILYPLEISGIPLEKSNCRVAELLQLVGLTAKSGYYPAHLSGGEKQRVGIARALAHYPEVLFCDEATSALDPKTTKEILELLQKVHTELDVTIVLITHEMDVIKQICNKVAVIEAGEILETGLVVDIFAQPKYATTKDLLQHASHDIPQEVINNLSPSRQLLSLRFKGQVAKEPIISQMIRKFDVDVNILQGWIDNLQNMMLGTLIVEFTGAPENIQQALAYLREQSVQCEAILK